MKHMITLLLLSIAICTLPAHADTSWSAIVGAGRSTFGWCGPMGCWRQAPLAYHDNRKVDTFVIGTRYSLNRIFDVDLLYHKFGTAKVGGDYVADDDYSPHLLQVKSDAKHYNIEMWSRTEGISLSLSPHYPVGLFDVRGRLGGFYYRQTVDSSNFREVGHRKTWIAGAGIDYRIGHSTIGIEYDLFGIVKIKDSPVGGWDCRHPGMRQVMMTYAYRF